MAHPSNIDALVYNGFLNYFRVYSFDDMDVFENQLAHGLRESQSLIIFLFFCCLQQSRQLTYSEAGLVGENFSYHMASSGDFNSSEALETKKKSLGMPVR